METIHPKKRKIPNKKITTRGRQQSEKKQYLENKEADQKNKGENQEDFLVSAMLWTVLAGSTFSLPL
ncbi:hypothetical protein NDU88_000636 [Pleurodeles waltl]|uniref:Uncharacterized protein n=1 Tax=Pleurodeles waltl TaxID=8319 RepID=A0AAV7SXV6_PLEWA|nr:hypothetical protein NDU88_000636 [Pleurodeles waltl]